MLSAVVTFCCCCCWHLFYCCFVGDLFGVTFALHCFCFVVRAGLDGLDDPIQKYLGDVASRDDF